MSILVFLILHLEEFIISECLESVRRIMDSEFSEENMHIEGSQGVRGRNSNNTFIKEKLGWTPKSTIRRWS